MPSAMTNVKITPFVPSAQTSQRNNVSLFRDKLLPMPVYNSPHRKINAEVRIKRVSKSRQVSASRKSKRQSSALSRNQ